MSPSHAPPIIAIAGPTAAGKSALALALCERVAAGGLPWAAAEIVSVDSAQVYRGMNIGTAKPDAATRASVPHHLIDLLDPAERYSAARFATDACSVILALQAREVVPILVGGTLLYFRALFDGFNALPAADPDLRAEIEAEAEREGWDAMHARLAEVDPPTAARLHPNDGQRIGRALEVHRLSGVPLSAHHAAPTTGVLDQMPLRFAVMPTDRQALAQRIEQRLHEMFAAGFVEEVAALRARGDLHSGLPSMRAVGYRQVWMHLDGEYGRNEALQRCIHATRQFARRQLTGLRGDRRWQTIDGAEPATVDKVLSQACAMQQA